MTILVLSLLLISITLAEQVEHGCYHNGRFYRNGETWIVNNSFTMKCTLSMKAVPTGCITPAGTSFPVNTIMKEDGVDWMCELNGDGSVERKRKSSSTADCAFGRKSGEKWVESYFEFECGEGGVQKFLGCVAPTGEKIRAGETKEVNGNRMVCRMHTNGTVAFGNPPLHRYFESVMQIRNIAVPEVVPGCRYNGRIYKNAETWTEKNAFKMRCVVESNGSWRTEVTGCITPSGLEVSVNSTKQENHIEWICESGFQGSIALKLKQIRNAECANGHKIGERWVESSFEFECGEGGVQKFIGCVAPTGERMADGEIKEIMGNKLQCRNHANGTVELGALPKEKYSECFGMDGIKHHHGSTWVENVMFEYKCFDFGVKAIRGCVVKEQGLQIPLGQTRFAGNTVFHCEFKDGQYRFYTTNKSDQY